MGPHDMRERVARLDSRLTIVSAPGTGARVELVLPYPGASGGG